MLTEAERAEPITADPLRSAARRSPSAFRSPPGAAPAPSRGAGPPKPARDAPTGPMGGGPPSAGGPPAPIGEGPPGPIGGGPPGNCANATVGAIERVASVMPATSAEGVFLFIVTSLSRIGSRGPAPACWARRSAQAQRSRTPGPQCHALIGGRRDRAGCETMRRRAPAGTTGSAGCRR